jgi:hypothetical protein
MPAFSTRTYDPVFAACALLDDPEHRALVVCRSRVFPISSPACLRSSFALADDVSHEHAAAANARHSEEGARCSVPGPVKETLLHAQLARQERIVRIDQIRSAGAPPSLPAPLLGDSLLSRSSSSSLGPVSSSASSASFVAEMEVASLVLRARDEQRTRRRGRGPPASPASSSAAAGSSLASVRHVATWYGVHSGMHPRLSDTVQPLASRDGAGAEVEGLVRDRRFLRYGDYLHAEGRDTTTLSAPSVGKGTPPSSLAPARRSG